MHDFVAVAAPLARTPEQGTGVYAEAAKKLGRLLASVADLTVAVGQAHLLRQRVATELRNISRCAARAPSEYKQNTQPTDIHHVPVPSSRFRSKFYGFKSCNTCS